ncbi:peptidase [Halomonas sp. MCCC 1A17488]|uniref:PepSY domain-containing protein n=1 Tax=unclassified Halomonas TaxID=2609666 RepID=UPI0018D230F1|nr:MULTISPECIES: PepSY domain-containing protein [unclassified Halomonas]MCE8016189.1 peptidase [Halomonas sp. MCCC 1A17488]MCG3239522.1 peptidase [Halomonas sp. MCCC 1A17488]QPP50557.1 PepSY domain-containing protein [Halomonas sp. SS10-MC5]
MKPSLPSPRKYLSRRAFVRRALAALWLSLLAAAPAFADRHWHDLHEAVRSGRLVALPQILDWLEARYEGQVLEVELERDDGRTIYEVEMLGPQGQVVEFEFDAASGELIGMEGVNIDGMRRKEEAR